MDDILTEIPFHTIPGLSTGHAQDNEGLTGCTVLLADTDIFRDSLLCMKRVLQMRAPLCSLLHLHICDVYTDCYHGSSYALIHRERLFKDKDARQDRDNGGKTNERRGSVHSYSRYCRIGKEKREN